MAVSELAVDGVVFPPVARPPGSGRSHFLAGAGVRGLEIGGNFIKFTAIGLYLEEDAAVSALAKKWVGKSADELASDVAFFRDVVTGDFEKFTRVTMILPLTGEQYSGKVTENCVAYWKAAGLYTDAEGAAVDKFKEAFKPETFPPGASILFTHSPAGVLTAAFSKDSSVPEAGGVAIENRPLCEAVLESIIGEHGEGVGAPQGGRGQPGRRRAAGGARPGLRVSGQRGEEENKAIGRDGICWPVQRGDAARRHLSSLFVVGVDESCSELLIDSPTHVWTLEFAVRVSSSLT